MVLVVTAIKISLRSFTVPTIKTKTDLQVVRHFPSKDVIIWSEHLKRNTWMNNPHWAALNRIYDGKLQQQRTRWNHTRRTNKYAKKRPSVLISENIATKLRWTDKQMFLRNPTDLCRYGKLQPYQSAWEWRTAVCQRASKHIFCAFPLSGSYHRNKVSYFLHMHQLQRLNSKSKYHSTYMVKVKVKWSRYRPGVAHRVGRGIALLFHDRGTRKGWVVSSMPRPHFNPGKDPVPILQEAG